jgi:hypothetical protein
VLALQRRLRVALGEAAEDFDVVRALEALGAPRSDDGQGLAELLTEAGVATPTDLVQLARVVAVSASATALTWARGLPAEDDRPPTADDVLRTSWAEAAWVVAEEPQDSERPPTGRSAGG